MLGVNHTRFEVVDPILRIVVLLGVFELLYEASMVIAHAKLLASFTLLLAACMIILVGYIHPIFALTTTPCLSSAFVSGVALVRH
jgi:hypothetical protein